MIRKSRICILALIFCLTFASVTGCAKRTQGTEGTNGTKDEQETGAGNETQEEQREENKKPLSEEEQLYYDLFDIQNYVQVKIDISEEELNKIQQDYAVYRNSKSPIYRKADKVTFIVGDKTYEIEEVGIRMKGNTSRTDFYEKGKGIYKLCHFRLSFDETFDDPAYYGSEAKVWNSEAERQARKDRTFATLSALEIKWNRNFDNTYVREYYANEMFRDFGVLAQRLNPCNMIIRDSNMGVYNIYEPVDKKFLKKYYDGEENDGDLYKAAWTMSPASYTMNVSYGVEDERTNYNYDLKTNKKTSNHSMLKNLLTTINGSSVSKEEFSKVVDMDYWAKFAAVSYFAGNPDDMRNNYNNHYVYFKPDGQAVFIPYDNDRMLGVTVGWNPDNTGMTAVSPFSDRAEGLQNNQMNPLYFLTVLTSSGFCYDEYVTALKEVADSKWMTSEHFESYYEAAKKHYEACVVPDKDYDNARKDRFFFSLEENDNMSMAQYIERKLETYRKNIGENSEG